MIKVNGCAFCKNAIRVAMQSRCRHASFCFGLQHNQVRLVKTLSTCNHLSSIDGSPIDHKPSSPRWNSSEQFHIRDEQVDLSVQFLRPRIQARLTMISFPSSFLLFSTGRGILSIKTHTFWHLATTATRALTNAL